LGKAVDKRVLRRVFGTVVCEDTDHEWEMFGMVVCGDTDHEGEALRYSDCST